MDKFFENLTHKIPKLYEHYLLLGKKYSQMAIRRGKKVGEKSKIQIELGRLKWELKQKYQKLGNYIKKKRSSHKKPRRSGVFRLTGGSEDIGCKQSLVHVPIIVRFSIIYIAYCMCRTFP